MGIVTSYDKLSLTMTNK